MSDNPKIERAVKLIRVLTPRFKEIGMTPKMWASVPMECRRSIYEGRLGLVVQRHPSAGKTTVTVTSRLPQKVFLMFGTEDE